MFRRGKTGRGDRSAEQALASSSAGTNVPSNERAVDDASVEDDDDNAKVTKHDKDDNNNNAWITALYFAAWFALNGLFNVYNKRVLDAVGLPWIMTFVQLSTGFALALPLWWCGFRRAPSTQQVSIRGDAHWLVPLGFYHLLSSAGGVHAIHSGSVSTFQVLKAMEPIVTSILAALVYGQIFPWQVYATVVLVVYGVVHAFGGGGAGGDHDGQNATDEDAGGPGAVSSVMVLGTFVSIVGASMRSLSSKQRLNKHNCDVTPSNLFAIMNATSLVLLFPFTLLDVSDLGNAQARIRESGESFMTLVAWAVMSGVFFYANNEIAFYALNRVHPITHAVANIVRRILIILTSVAFLNDSLTARRTTGAAIAIFGVFLYSMAKYRYGGNGNAVGVAVKPTTASSSSQYAASFKWFVGLLAAAMSFMAAKQSIVPPPPPPPQKLVSASVELPSASAADGAAFPSSASDPSTLPAQPLTHMLRANDVPLDQMTHVFNRMEELRQIQMNRNDDGHALPKNASRAKATNKVLCSVGLTESSMASLGRVWVDVLGGIVGHAATDHRSVRPTDEAFAPCDAIVSAGSAYHIASEWAFDSPVPVINVWNEDGYCPQAALLFAFSLAQKRRRELDDNGNNDGSTPNKYTTDILSNVEASSRRNKRRPCSGYLDGVDSFMATLSWNEVSRLFNIKLPKDMCSTRDEGNNEQRFWPSKSIYESPVTSEPAPLLLAAMAELALAKAGKLPSSFQFPGVRCTPGLVASGKINGHDPHFVFAEEGTVRFALEWERVTKVKYGRSGGFDQAAAVVKAKIDPQELALFVVVRGNEAASSLKNCRMCNEVGGSTLTRGELFIRQFFPGTAVVYREHLISHAFHGFFDSPFEKALVLAIHGGGSEPVECASYLARRGMDPIVLKPCDTSLLRIADAYAVVSRYMPEVTGWEKKKRHSYNLEWAGTFMGYTGLGKHLPCLEAIEEELLAPPGRAKRWDALNLIKTKCQRSWARNETTREFPKHLPLEIQRDIASTFEELFERTVLHIMSQLADHLNDVDGIVLAGGVALNVKLTQRIWNHYDKPVWVSSAPSDPGLGVGGAWSVCHPPRDSVPLQYHGFPLLDKGNLPSTANEWGSNSENIGMGEEAAARLAFLLAVEKKIVAMVIGNQEYGPRALGHRSLLAYPDSIEIRDRMNALKFRQFYRPTCPTVAEEFVGEMFHNPQNIRSPFMSFAPELQDWVKRDLPAVWHYDGTARPQTLSKSTEPFIHSLLMSIPKVRKDGKPIVINTSFNIKGQPIINTLEDTLFMLCDRPQLDYVFVEGYLFRLEGNATHHQCDKLKLTASQ